MRGGKKIMQNLKINNKVRKYRVWQRLTQEYLAKKLKISIHHLRQIENEFKYPKYQVRSRICKYFNVNQDQMFIGE
jgi:DNA-binding XRE family transcriptional regulator